MTRAGTIPLSDLEWIKIHFNTKKRKNTKAGLKQLLADTGGDIIMNGAIFLNNCQPCCHLKADGVVKCNPGYQAWCISWDTPTNFAVRAIPKTGSSYANYMECVHAIINGKKISPMKYGKDMAYACNRTAVGTKDGKFAYYCTEDNLTPETLRDRLFDAGWSDAIMMDGGGSACIMDQDGNGFAGDGRYIPFYLVVKLTEKDIEPKGEKPMEFEIKAYSLKKEGEVFLTKHFQVKEFACKDGSDTVFIAEKLPMVCEYIRVRTGKAFKPNSAYRTPEHNKKEGGEEFSMHLYGAAADIPKLTGFTPKQMAAIAREIMPGWGGVGIYDWGIHVDVRKEKADWKG